MKAPVPSPHPYHVTVRANFVTYGYQVDVELDGQNVITLCRDFADDHSIPSLQARFIDHMLQAVESFRKGL